MFAIYTSEIRYIAKHYKSRIHSIHLTCLPPSSLKKINISGSWHRIGHISHNLDQTQPSWDNENLLYSLQRCAMCLQHFSPTISTILCKLRAWGASQYLWTCEPVHSCLSRQSEYLSAPAQKQSFTSIDDMIKTEESLWHKLSGQQHKWKRMAVFFIGVDTFMQLWQCQDIQLYNVWGQHQMS